MAIIVSCPGCKQNLQVPEQSFDGMVQCPGCQQTFQPATLGATKSGPVPPPLPAGETASDDEEEYERPLEEDEGKDRPRKRKRKSRPSRSSDGGYYNELMRKQRKLMSPHRGTMILVLGILSLTCGFVFGIVAWILGTNDLNEIYSGRMDPAGESLTKTGRILGIIGICLNVGGIVTCCLCGGVGTITGGR